MANIRTKRRRISFISTFLSITLVLFLVGLFALLVYHANILKDYMKENVQVSILFMDDVNEPDVLRLKTNLEERQGVREVEYISKEEAREIMVRDLGEDVELILGYNPFPASVDVYFNAEHATADSLDKFSEEIVSNARVREVYYQQALVRNIDRNVQIAAAIILFLAVVFLIIVIALINSTIRLTLYSKRFLIKSMQLVGATWWFIRKPFVLRAMLHGLLGGIVASIMLLSLAYFMQQRYDFLVIEETYKLYGATLLGLIILGVLITGISSFFSVNRYLRLKLDDLY